MKTNQAGFTLPELIVSLAVTTLLSLVIASYMVDNLQQSTIANIRGNMLSEAAESLDLASNDVRLSSNADQNNRWTDPNNTGWTSNSSTLVLASAAKNTSGKIMFVDAKNYIPEKNNLVYFVSGGTLFKRVLADPVTGNAAKTTCPKTKVTAICPADKELLHNVITFTVAYLDGQNQAVTPTNARSIELRVITSRQLFSNPIKADYTTRMVFRND